MKRVLLCFALVTATFQTPTAIAARAIVTDPNFVPDDTWLLVKVLNRIGGLAMPTQPPVLPEYAAHLFNDDKVYTPLPSTSQFWLPKERPLFVLEFQPSGTQGDFSQHNLTRQIAAMADVVEIHNLGSAMATGQLVDFFNYKSLKNGSYIDSRTEFTRTFNIPEPATLAMGCLAFLSLAALRRRK